MAGEKPIIEILAALGIAIVVLLLSDQIAALGNWGYLGAFFISLMGSATILVPVPSWAVVIGLSKSLDPVILGIVAGIGSAIGELTAYLFGSGMGTLIERKTEFKRQKEWMQKNDFAAIFVLSFIPNPLFDMAGLAAGAAKVPWFRFLLFCALGRILRFVIFGFAGYYFFNGF